MTMNNFQNLKNSIFSKTIDQLKLFVSTIQTQRRKIRSNWIHELEPLKFLIILSSLPFIISFYQMFYQKNSNSKRYLFFAKNLPFLTIPIEKIHLDTYLYFLKNNIWFEIDPKLSKINWSPDDLLIESSMNTFSTTLVSYVQNKNIKNSFKSSISSKSKYKLIWNQQPENSFETFYKNLDEIPRYLQSPEKTLTNELNKQNLLKLIDEDNFSRLINNVKQEYLISNKTFNSIKVSGFSTTTPYIKLIGFKNFKMTSHHLKPNNFNKRYKNLLTKNTLLEKELQLIFRQGNLIPNLSSQFKKRDILNYFNQFRKFKNNDITFFQNLINKIDQIYQGKSLVFTRLMSGYSYPDMLENELTYFLIQGKFSKNKNIQILFPISYLFPTKIDFNLENPPEFFIQSIKQNLINDLTKEIQYDGPGILLDENTGLDWETRSSNSKSLREWISQYFLSNNPLTDLTNNFFGVFESSTNQSQFLENFEKLNSYWVKNLPIEQKASISNTSFSFLKFKRSFHLPFFNKSDWKKFIESDLKLGVSKRLDYGIPLLPILETRIPTKKTNANLFTYRNAIDYDFLENVSNAHYLVNNNLKSKKSIESPQYSNFVLNTLTYLPTENFSIQFSSGIYKNTPTLQNISSFCDLWEPLTIESWLVVSQIGFAFLIFHTLKALADNYGRELLVYLLDLVALLGFVEENLKQEIEILMGHREKGFRIIKNINKNFTDIGGIQNLLPEIVDIIWFLRNSAREFSVSKTLPRGILLTGPPGTGKTLLVQALAGEAEVPVIASSGSSLLEPGESGALKLEILFQEARRLAPCIVFIDEIDTIAQKREQVLQNPMGEDEILESLSNPILIYQQEKLSHQNFENLEDIVNAVSIQQEMHKEKLRILMQLLVELDGMKNRDGVIVIGATNRPEILDTAVLRPGRFDKVLDIGLPNPEKRYEILNLYSKNIGIEKNISWNYLINRTAGYSAADLASIMNQSTLHAILYCTSHTLETIELGIDRITTIGLEQPHKTSISKLNSLKDTKNIFLLQVAYYQAGKILLSSVLKNHPDTLVSYLWPRRPNARGLQIQKNLQKYFFKFARRVDLEHRLIGCYAGKASEILLLQEFGLDFNLSDFGFEDINFAQTLITSMVEDWFLYSKNILNQKNSDILTNFNEKEYRNASEKISFFQSFLTKFGFELFNSNTVLKEKTDNFISSDSQNHYSLPKWQSTISDDFEIATRRFSDWYRLYLPEPEQNERNLEWIPPDEFYHTNDTLQKLSKSTNWSQLNLIKIDYEKHNLILESFNHAFNILNTNREILDQLAFELIYKEILRESEIKEILNFFNLTDENIGEKTIDLEFNKIKILNKTWGKNSRRSKTRFINLKQLFD